MLKLISRAIAALSCISFTHASIATTYQPSAQEFEQQLLEIFSELEDGDSIALPAGHFSFSSSLQIVAKRITVRGRGAAQTLLDFSEQTSGAQALLVRGWDIELSGFSILHPAGDGLVVRNSARVNLSDIRIDMTRKDKGTAGAYAIYPVSSRHITMDNIEATGASDAGIYLGQTMFASIKNSKAYGNVTGLNIENSMFVLVDNNQLYRNSIGAFISSLPDMIYPSSKNILLRNNFYYENNIKNFANEGALVRQLGSGVGLELIAVKDLWMENQIFKSHMRGDVVIAGYQHLSRPPAPGTFKQNTSNVILMSIQSEQDPLVDQDSIDQVKACQKGSIYLKVVPTKEVRAAGSVDCNKTLPKKILVELPQQKSNSAI